MQLQRTILWIVFSMSLLFLWDNWQKHNGKPSMFGGPTATDAAGKAPAAGAAPAADGSVPSAPASVAAPTAAAVPGATAAGAAPASGATPAAGGVKPLRVRSDVLALDIDPVGGQILRGELLKHKANHDTSGKADVGGVVLLQNEPGRMYVAQSGLIGGAEGAAFPTHKTPFTIADAPRELADGSDAIEVTMTAESGGVKLERTYRLARGSYVVEVRDTVSNTGAAPVRPTLYMQLLRHGEPPVGESQFYSTYTGPVVYTEEKKFQKVAFSDIEKGKPDHVKSASDGWAGIIQHYFVSAWLPTDKAPREFFSRRIADNLYAVGALQPLGELAPQAKTSAQTRLLIAPQDQNMLEKVAPGLDLSVDYGWLTVVAKPIFWLLEKLYGLVGNWGWAIVLLTIIIKTIFFPLQAASYKSMARMKAVSPRLMALRERYGNDRVKLNTAMMELYKEEKINPLGGCLPIVVQIPVFIALYWVLL
ncbi:MAG TPA: membrane protein insertase YidC, partial [Quisquiliibacterium sp.]|nr:membrane protein insertase YidC [Quisquiliibacterium sp.]